MRIAILTYYEIANYGTLLQAYGLWKFLEARGHKVEFLNEPYGRSMFARQRPSWRSFATMHPIRTCHGLLNQYLYNSMTKFNKVFPRTRRFETIEDLTENFMGYDAVVIGSDLIWHPKWCSPKYIDIAFLGFVKDGCKKISISPSFSASTWDASGRKAAGKLLARFDGIGVRESTGKKIVQDISGRSDAEVFIDSALLLTAEEYKRHLSPTQETNPFIFNYILGWSDGKLERSLLDLAKNKLSTPTVLGQYSTTRSLRNYVMSKARLSRRISIGEWLRRIHDASFVLTNSFHGTVFSILMHKPFATILIRGEMSCLNERAMSLLCLLGLESRMMYADEPDKLSAAIDNKINWANVDARLVSERKRVSAFLERFCL